MKLKNLISLSNLPEYHIFGPKRTEFLQEFEGLLNSPDFNPSIVQLSSATLIGKNMNLNSPDYWKTLSDLILKSVHKVTKFNSDSLSIIHRNFMLKFPMIGNDFFETLEFRMLLFQDCLNNLSVSNLAKGVCTRNTQNKEILNELERLYVKRMKGFNKQDLGMMGYCMTIHPHFGIGEAFRNELERVLKNGVDDSNLFMLVNVSRGIASRGWYFEKFIMDAVKIIEKNSDRLGYIQITQFSWAIAEFNKGIEVPLLEKIMDRRL